MLLFSLLVVVIFRFSLPGGATRATQASAPGLLWIAYVFAALLGLNRSFSLELENDALSGIALSPVDRGWIFLGKAASNWLILGVAQAITGGAFALVFDVDLKAIALRLAGVVALGSLGVCRVGALFAAVAVRTRFREVMLPLLLLPLLVPVLLGAVRATAGLLETGALEFEPVQLLLVTDATYLIVSFGSSSITSSTSERDAAGLRLRCPGSAAACVLRAASRSPRFATLWAGISSSSAPPSTPHAGGRPEGSSTFGTCPAPFRRTRISSRTSTCAAPSACRAMTSGSTRFAAASAEVGVVFCTLMILTCQISAKGTWVRLRSAWDPSLKVASCCCGSSSSPYLLLHSFAEEALRTARFRGNLYGMAGRARGPAATITAIEFVRLAPPCTPTISQRRSIEAGMGGPSRSASPLRLAAPVRLLFLRTDLESLRAEALNAEKACLRLTSPGWRQTRSRRNSSFSTRRSAPGLARSTIKPRLKFAFQAVDTYWSLKEATASPSPEKGRRLRAGIPSRTHPRPYDQASEASDRCCRPWKFITLERLSAPAATSSPRRPRTRRIGTGTDARDAACAEPEQ